VGESGCGKTVTCLGLLRLLPQASASVLSGRAWYAGRDLLSLPADDLRALRGSEIAMIFQEPSAALNPLLTIGTQLRMPFRHHAFDGDPEARIAELLAKVGFSEPGRVLSAYPHELSGGMLQRVLIAHALLLRPRLLLADEPTTALDVTVQAQILELLGELQRESGLSVVLITHNLALVAQYAGRVAVMYAGRIVEEAPVAAFLENPRHPYSQGLLAALPKLDVAGKLSPIPGTVPSPRNYPQGCRFRDRCPKAFERCGEEPGWIEVAEGHKVACHLYPHSAPQNHVIGSHPSPLQRGGGQ
jgi:oligopeptide/dipeptide ABC transporter ATP-binding protein